jgi:DivIVA domain-containing protein
MSDWLTATEARETSFGKPPTGRRGYNEDEVDAFPERAEAAIAQLDSRR